MPDEASRAQLAALPLFHGASRELLDAVVEAGVPRSFGAGELILEEGTEGNEMYLILDGEVEVTKGQGSDCMLLARRGAGELVGEMALIDASRRSATVRAAKPTLTLEFSGEAWRRIWVREPQLLFPMVQSLTSRLRSADLLMIEDLIRKNEELAQAYAELKAAQAALVEKERLERELELARQLQQSMLPRRFPAIPGYSIAAQSRPARQVGGDFYDVIAVSPRRAVVVMADVSDKGMPAALYMALTRSLIRAEAKRSKSPREMLLRTHRLLTEISQSSMFFTAFCGVLDPLTGVMTFARAGHDRPLLYNPETRKGRWVDARGMMLGPLPDVFLEESQIRIEPGEALVLYTDGVTDANDPSGDFFGEDRLRRFVEGATDHAAQALCDGILASVEGFQAGATQFDDIAVLVVSREDAQPGSSSRP
jgi:serine phosphatase RsbU (regulator of sigma subunit)